MPKRSRLDGNGLVQRHCHPRPSPDKAVSAGPLPWHSAQPGPSPTGPASRSSEQRLSRAPQFWPKLLLQSRTPCVLTRSSFLATLLQRLPCPALPRTCARSDGELGPQKYKGQAPDGSPLLPPAPTSAPALSHTHTSRLLPALLLPLAFSTKCCSLRGLPPRSQATNTPTPMSAHTSGPS